MVSALNTFYQKEVFESSICQMMISIVNCAHEDACLITLEYPILIVVVEGGSFTVSSRTYTPFLANPLLP